MIGIIVAATIELGSNDCGEDIGVGAYQRDLLLRSSLPAGRRNLARLG
jgi:hypothetical protein